VPAAAVVGLLTEGACVLPLKLLGPVHEKVWGAVPDPVVVLKLREVPAHTGLLEEIAGVGVPPDLNARVWVAVAVQVLLSVMVTV
jgi:hypothetical protein